jgi:hypothetical protein
MSSMGKIGGIAVLAGLTAAVAAQMPELRRYMKIRSM